MARLQRIMCGQSTIAPEQMPYSGMTHKHYEIRGRTTTWDPFKTSHSTSLLGPEHKAESQRRVIEFWDIFGSRGKDPKYLNSSDRIYSLLAITNHDMGSEVDYTESVVHKIWRSADHFAAWTSGERMRDLWHALKLG